MKALIAEPVHERLGIEVADTRRDTAMAPFRHRSDRLLLAGPAQRVRAIRHFASRDACDIGGLGPSTVQALVEAGLVHTVADLFVLTDADLRGLPRFGPVAANRLASAIHARRRVSLDRFLFALGIPSVGARTAGRLAGHFKTLAALRRATATHIAMTPGVGPAAARDVASFFRTPNNQAVIDALLRHGVRVLSHHPRTAGSMR